MNWPYVLRLALASFRGGLGPARSFIACIALGVAAMAALDLAGLAVQNGLARDGRVLLGGDVELNRVHVRPTDDERAALLPLGQVSEVATLRAMARTADGARQALVDLKAVDGAYPLFGAFGVAGGAPLTQALSQDGAVADPALADQLGLAVGEPFQLAGKTVRLAGLIAAEPDRLAAGPSFGPRLVVSLATLESAGLAAPGSLVDWRLRIARDANAPVPAERAAVSRFVDTALPTAGFSVRDSRNPAPQAAFAVRRLGEALTLVALAALVIGGIGVANGAAAFMTRSRPSFAVFRALGASRAQITAVLALQLTLAVAAGVVLGLLLGAALPAAAFALLGPGAVPIAFALDAGTMARAAAAGTLVAAMFSLWPIGLAGQTRAAQLLRPGAPAIGGRWPPLTIIVLCVAALGALVAMMLTGSGAPTITIAVLAGLAAAIAMFAGIGRAAAAAARRLPRPQVPEFSLALANLGDNAGLTRTLMVSLGTGLTLLTLVASLGASIDGELSARVPERAPSHFFLGIARADEQRFSQRLTALAPGGMVESAPMLRGRITAVKSIPAADVVAAEGSRWLLSGDRGLTFAAAPPADSRIVQGEWWPRDYSGDPLVSLEAEAAAGLGLKPGDTLAVNVLGRELTARVANIRTVDWQSLGINFVMIFSPTALSAAPYGLLATLDWKGDAATEAAMTRAIAGEFQGVSIIRVADAVATVSALVGRIRQAAGGAAGLTLLAGVLVLAGAVAAARAARARQGVILRMVGAPPRSILTATLIEAAALGLIACAVALPLGLAGAAAIAQGLLGVEFVAGGWAVAALALGTLAGMLGLGIVLARAALRVRPAALLREG